MEVADGAVELLDERVDDGGATVVTISLDTPGLPPGTNGINVRERERFRVVIEDAAGTRPTRRRRRPPERGR